MDGVSLTVTTSSSIKCPKNAETAKETLQTILLNQSKKGNSSSAEKK
ncbi:hypothetical protein [Gracilibacillus boraciitolerans]|nr:hypothetical protein [Gracilibacillus boraciitolerans]